MRAEEITLNLTTLCRQRRECRKRDKSESPGLVSRGIELTRGSRGGVSAVGVKMVYAFCFCSLFLFSFLFPFLFVLPSNIFSVREIS